MLTARYDIFWNSIYFEICYDKNDITKLFLLFQICFRHSCRTKLIASLNKKLIEEQKSFIRGRPFGWMVELKEFVKISRNLLSPLISRWVERLGVSHEYSCWIYLFRCMSWSRFEGGG